MNESLNVGRTGKRNLLPSKQAQRDYLRIMRTAADNGDLLSMGLLVGLAKLEEHNAEAKEQARRDRLLSEFKQDTAGKDPLQILDRGRRYLLDLIEQLPEIEDQPRDAAGIQQGQGPRDAAPAATTGKAGSTASGNSDRSGESDSRLSAEAEHPTQAEKV
jgi:hypothetical protein